ncbi:MAG: hypothetical protein K5790_02265 [Nitrosopumilus sp.]|uniref:hypothetical protein n=1 Tax=Nitrosopumilus sp. TaxID=2024843 RepID=UPI00247E14E7|nr:hypothetical protein [Nitrosopumilus sp.]MCV0392099.1 hypothetical protein [Nitrosopumilus sp.]
MSSENIKSDVVDAPKTILKNHWDYQPKIGSELGHHVTRQSEHQILLDFISRRSEGSMLISGHRGAGKTSSVFKAVNESVTMNPKIKPILIKATSINLEEEKKKNILRSFIRSLYKISKEDSNFSSDLKSKTSQLYNKAIASQVKNEKLFEEKIFRKKTYRIHVNLISAISIIVVSSLFFLGLLSDYSWLFPLISILGGGWLLFDYSKIVKKTSSDLASYYYLHDYDFSTMQSELESLLEKFQEENFKILFILDELDKVGDDSFEIISNLKMLINQGNALFIFITDPKFLTTIKDKSSPSSTLFSQLLFLKRPLFDEMKEFVTEIILNGKELTSREDYNNFQNYLCYKSKTSFFDLYDVIRDCIITNDIEGPVIDLTLNGQKITQANLQKSIEWVYDRKKLSSPSLWSENDLLLSTLYHVCDQLENLPILDNVTVDKTTFKFNVNSINLTNPKLFSATMDLLIFLTSQGYLQKINDFQFQKIGTISSINETKGGVFVEEQRKFIEEYEHMLNIAINMANSHNNHINNLGEIFSIENINSKWNSFVDCITPYFNITTLAEHRVIYFDLVGDDPSVYPSEQLQKMTAEIRNGYVQLKKGFLTLLTSLFGKQITNLQIGATLGDISRGVLTASGIPNATFHHNELTYNGAQSHKLEHIIICENISVDFLKKLLKATNSNILIISYGDLADNAKYANVSSLSINSLQQGLDELNTLSEGYKKYLFLPLTIPISSDDLKNLFEIL